VVAAPPPATTQDKGFQDILRGPTCFWPIGSTRNEAAGPVNEDETAGSQV
jgi:hypothetical protein